MPPSAPDDSVVGEVYVYLVNEAVDVWRPTTGRRLAGGRYLLLPTDDYEGSGEEWEFPPGSIVECETRTLSGGFESAPRLVAVRRVPQTDREQQP